MTTCLVTGVLRAPSGAPLAAARVLIEPAPVAARLGSGGLTAPVAVEVQTDGAGALSVSLLPGVYSLRALVVSDGREREALLRLIDVPAAETADIEDLLVWLPTPQSVLDAAASARRAANAAAASERAGAGMIFADGEGTFPGSLRAFFHPGTLLGDTTAAVTIDGVTYQIPVTQLEVPA